MPLSASSRARKVCYDPAPRSLPSFLFLPVCPPRAVSLSSFLMSAYPSLPSSSLSPLL